MASELNLRLLPKISLKIWILFMFGFAIYLRSSAQFCERRYVNGQWISKGDCGGPGRMSEMQKELQRRIKDEKRKKCTASKGWTVFQRRINGDVDFYRDWDDYVGGFGDCNRDLWLGLETLHQLTKGGDMKLEIKMTSRDGEGWVAKYSNLSIGPGSDNYRLHASGFSGNATFDALVRSNGRQFSTKDADHDGESPYNCAYLREGGWWYGSKHDKCGNSNLNGNFSKTDEEVGGIWWTGDTNGGGGPDKRHFLRFSEMRLRKRA